MDAPDDRGGITRYRMQEEPEYGNILDEKENYDLQQVVMVYVAHARADMENRLLNLLGELFVSEDDASRKKVELVEHYDIDLNDNEERLVSTMCNLSVGVYERGRENALRKTAVRLLDMGLSVEVVAKGTDLPVEKVEEIKKEIEEKKV